MNPSKFTKYQLDIVSSIFLSAFLDLSPLSENVIIYIYIYWVTLDDPTDYKDTIK